jgi:hypothetical protein
MHQTNIDKLKEGFNYLVIESEIPSLFVFLRHKTHTSQPEPKNTIPTTLATILNAYIENNTMLKNDFIFRLESKDFKKNYVQSKLTEKLQKNLFSNTQVKISVNLIRASKSTYNDTIPMSLAERKQIAQQVGHSLSTHMHLC